MVIELNIVARGVVGSVEVVGVGRELSGEGVDSLDPGLDTKVLTAGADLIFSAVDSVRDLLVGETELLGLEHELLLDAVEGSDLLEFVGAVNDVLDLVKEPLVNLAQVVDLVDRVAFVEHSLTNSEPAAVGGVLEHVVDVLKVITLETSELGVNHADSLLERFFESTADGHDFTNGLHGRANVTVDVLELAQVPTGHLGNNVVKRGLEVGSSRASDGVGQLRQSVSQTDLCSGVSERVASSLGSESGRTRETSVDLNDTVVETIRRKSVLNVTLSNDTQVTNDLDSGSAEHVVLLITEGLRRRDDDTVTSVDAERIKVLHVADGNAVISGITDDLVFGLLPALERLFDENLR